MVLPSRERYPYRSILRRPLRPSVRRIPDLHGTRTSSDTVTVSLNRNRTHSWNGEEWEGPNCRPSLSESRPTSWDPLQNGLTMTTSKGDESSDTLRYTQTRHGDTLEFPRGIQTDLRSLPTPREDIDPYVFRYYPYTSGFQDNEWGRDPVHRRRSRIVRTTCPSARGGKE